VRGDSGSPWFEGVPSSSGELRSSTYGADRVPAARDLVVVVWALVVVVEVEMEMEMVAVAVQLCQLPRGNCLHEPGPTDVLLAS
jgi:hypothetical protein